MKALFIGSSTVDINATGRALKVRQSTHAQHPEKHLELSFASKTLLDDVAVTTGGSAANSAVACAVLGTQVDLVSAVGKDYFGELVLSDLKEHRVLTDHVHRFDTKTSLGINLLSKGGEKTNLVFKGATDELSAKDLSEALVKNSDALVCTSLASAKNQSLFNKAIRLAKKHKKFSVFAPSITMLRKERKALQKKAGFDVAVLNFEEAGFLLHTHKPLDKLDNLPGKINIVTKDTEGTYLYANGQNWHIPTLKVNAVDTTGAGDSFTGALVHGLLNGFDAVDAVKLGTAVACWNLLEVGAKVHGTRNQILSFFEKNKQRMKERIL